MIWENDGNTIDKDKFAIGILFGSLSAFAGYYGLFFSPVGQWEELPSVIILALLQVVMTGGIAVLCYGRNRNGAAMLISVTAPLAAYACLTADSWESRILIAAGVPALYGIIRPLTHWFRRAFRRHDKLEPLTPEERLRFLRRIIKIEAKNLGIRELPTLEMAGLPAGTYACYSQTVNRISIGRMELIRENPNSKELIWAVAHECFHAAQFQNVITYNAHTASKLNSEQRRIIDQYRYECQNYCSGKKNYRAYKNQLLERHAERYARMRWKYYRKHMDRLAAPYLKKHWENRGTSRGDGKGRRGRS